MAGVPQLRSHGADSQVKVLRSSFRWIDSRLILRDA